VLWNADNPYAGLVFKETKAKSHQFRLLHPYVTLTEDDDASGTFGPVSFSQTEAAPTSRAHVSDCQSKEDNYVEESG
jgi:hypothetical protein